MGSFALLLLSACGPASSGPRKTPIRVQTQVVAFAKSAPALIVTGEIRPRVRSDLSFRVSGRVSERNVDVGARVSVGDVLARLEPKEQEADVRTAEAAVRAAEAQVWQTSSTFERQTALLARGFTTRRDYDQAEEAFRTAHASLDSANAQLQTARDRLSDTVLRASAAGIITARSIETGQVVQAAQAAFTIAQDGPRDAVFDVDESRLGDDVLDSRIEVTLLSDPATVVVGTVREIAPTVDAATGTVRVKVGIDHPPPTMTLRAPVSGVWRFKATELARLPWTVLASREGDPAVWVVNPDTRAVSLRSVVIATYDTETVLIRSGLKPGEIVVSAGAQFLRANQIVAAAEEAQS
ncbi:MAG: efflux RND transporter periplasmic adaptor subunit [Xanthobacteraceae bacterium]|nr:efflux RND transporter periplasmic adaptor subunit [Xanthobacteraceae bacterium]